MYIHPNISPQFWLREMALRWLITSLGPCICHSWCSVACVSSYVSTTHHNHPLSTQTANANGIAFSVCLSDLNLFYVCKHCRLGPDCYSSRLLSKRRSTSTLPIYHSKKSSPRDDKWHMTPVCISVLFQESISLHVLLALRMQSWFWCSEVPVLQGNGE